MAPKLDQMKFDKSFLLFSFLRIITVFSHLREYKINVHRHLIIINQHIINSGKLAQELLS